nr:hypothetical protein BaRGS_024874 [Batillaria attramentaria]
MAETERGNWNNWLEFLFSTIGCLVGLGNVWRFPYVCYTNGGAAFLIPYLIAMVLCGVPMMFLEMVYCQYSNLGPGRVWVICPLFRGIGYGMVVMTSVVSLYYNVIIAWALYYMVMCFSSSLPWATCDNSWNSLGCIPVGSGGNDVNLNGTLNYTTGESSTVTVTSLVVNTTAAITVGKRQSSVEEFWINHVLQPTENINELGAVRWQLLLCLLAAWTVVFFCLFKDIKTSGKVVYVAAVLPYVVLLALLIRGALLPGAVDGVVYFVVPQWHRLLDWKVWMAASSQVFYSAGIGWGGVSTLASFNRFHNNCYRDAMILPALDAVTSVFAGFVIFVYLGYMAHVQGTTLDKVVTEGTGLAFIAYPEALASMPLPQLWGVLFFIVLFTVGLDSQFVHVQTITSAIADTFPFYFGSKKRWITLAVCLLGFVLGIPFVTQGGLHVLSLCDWYVASISVMLLAVGETLVLAWIYGTGRLYDDLAMMIGYRPSAIWHVVWRIVSPSFVAVTWVLGMISWKPLSGFPRWTIGLGVVIALLPLLPVPVMALVQLTRHSSGSFLQRLRSSLRPSPDWQPALDKVKDGDGEENGECHKLQHWTPDAEPQM